MQTQFRSGLAAFPLPQWLMQEARQKLVLLINHVLMQEPIAMQRLLQHQNKTIAFIWQSLHIHVRITPAGLFNPVQPMPPTQDAASSAQTFSQDADLRVELEQRNLPALVLQLAREQRPSTHIEGDVQLAAELNWLMQHVRWDVEGDLARIVGPIPAHHIVQMMQNIREAFLRVTSPSPASTQDTSSESFSTGRAA